MELTILGCWSPYPAVGGACSSYLVQTSTGPFLLDCGNGALSKLQEQVDFRKLRGVIISHLHPDHYLDLYPLRHAVEGAIRDGSRKDKLMVILPSQPKEAFRTIYNFKQAFEVVPIEGLEVKEKTETGEAIRKIDFEKTSIKFFPTTHPILTYATSFEEAEAAKVRKLVYSGDTGFKEEFINFSAEAQILLCEASLQEAHKDLTKLGHLTAREAGIIGEKAQVKTLILTHFWPEVDLNITYYEAKETFANKVIIAKSGERYQV